MLDFYYTERLAGRRPPVPMRPPEEISPIEERVRRAAMPLGYLALRRVAELLAIAATLPVTAALCAVTAIGIAIDSPGPVLILQERKGRGGMTFRIAKFRSMYAGETSGAVPTVRGDPRVTRVGRFIRRYHLDELPQLWNVVRGEMSLIGPRPEPKPLAERYEAVYPHYRYRYMVKPGITGWAQVEQGHTSDVDDIRIKLEHDFHYILNLSLKLDLVIMARTLRALGTGSGAR
jgi:lipopolysaccharide/colanic/teichoic acid biosynthesis glycosyltransferase